MQRQYDYLAALNAQNFSNFRLRQDMRFRNSWMAKVQKDRYRAQLRNLKNRSEI